MQKTITLRDGNTISVPVTVNKEKKTVSVQVNNEWFKMQAGKNRVLAANKYKGHFWGQIVNTTKGRQVVFAHNGHNYAASDAITAFVRMARSEL